MKSRFQLPLTAAVLGVLALLAMQIFDGMRGYLCLCSGQAVPTQSSHCHGPHGTECHAGETLQGMHHDEEGSGPRHDHQLLTDEPLGRLADAAPLAMAPVLPLLALLPGVELRAPRAEGMPSEWTLRASEDSPPRGVAVARTVVLLI